jgi:hypothetical protein
MFVRHDEAERYRAEGWTVKPLRCHHGRYAMLAKR